MSVQLQTMLGFVLTAVATLTNRHRKEQEASSVILAAMLTLHEARQKERA